MSGKSNEQGFEEEAADYIQRTAEPGETLRERHMKRQVFLAGLQSGVATFLPRGVSHAAACDGVINHINNGNSGQEPQRILLQLFHD